jgi:lipoprotein-anchoring transpeptidase ErfK/SrfK
MLAGSVTAHADPSWDREGRFTGGAPSSQLGKWNFLGIGSGGSGPIARQTVAIQTKEAPGTIIVNTAERRLYLVPATGRRCVTASASAASVSPGRA